MAGESFWQPLPSGGGGSGLLAVTTYNPANANAEVYDETAAGDLSATAVNDVEETGFDISATGYSGGAVGDKLGVHWSAVKEL